MDEHEKKKYERVINWFKNKKQPPFKIDLELHRRCNSKCLTCSRRADPNYERINEYSAQIEMPLKKWIEIVDEAGKIGVKEWHIAGGGEPMFLPEVTLPVMREIKKFGMLGIITTNGTLWNSRIVEEVVRMSWDRVHFSIDGPDAKTHDYLRNVPGTFKKVVNTIKLFHHFKKKYKSEKPMINMNTVLSVKNYNKLPALVKFAYEMGIEYMFVDPLIVYSKIGEKLKLKKKHLKEFPSYLKEAIELAKKYGIFNNFSGLEQNLTQQLVEKSSRMHEVVEDDTKKLKKLLKKSSLKFLTIPCHKPWWHMTIKCDGRTTSCDVPIVGGDNIRNKTLMEVWNGEYFEWLRRKLASKNIPDFCAQCNPSHVTQERRMRIEILKEIEPRAVEKLLKLWCS